MLCPRGRDFFRVAYNFFALFGRDSAPYENTSAPLKTESAPDEKKLVPLYQIMIIKHKNISIQMVTSSTLVRRKKRIVFFPSHLQFQTDL